MKRLPPEEEAKITERLQALAEQDEPVQLPPSLQSSALLEKLQEQPSLVSMDGGVLTRRRSVYVIATCAAAFLMVIGLSRVLPGFSMSESMAANGVSSSAAYAASTVSASQSVAQDYQQIAEALRLMSGASAGVSAANQALSAAPKAADASPAAAAGEIQDLETTPEEAKLQQEVSGQTPDSQPASEPAGESIEESVPEDGDFRDASVPVLYGYASANNLVTRSGEWVYWLEQNENTTLHLINASTMEPEAAISLPEAAMVQELAAYSNLVVCIDPYRFATGEDEPGITVYLYQLEEDNSASLLNVVSVSGIYEQSYLSTDGTLFLASNQWLSYDDVERNASSGAEKDVAEFEKVLPKVYNAQLQEKASPVPAENISVIDSPLQPNYLNVTAIDLANGGAVCTWSFLGREGSVTIGDHVMSMITADGEGGSQLINIEFSGNTVRYRISKSIPEE